MRIHIVQIAQPFPRELLAIIGGGALQLKKGLNSATSMVLGFYGGRIGGVPLPPTMKLSWREARRQKGSSSKYQWKRDLKQEAWKQWELWRSKIMKKNNG